MVDENMDHRNRQPLTFAADVIVVGAGPSGISAALTAAKAGAQVLLVDEHSKPGGTLDHAGLHTICGLYLPDRSKATYVSDRARMWAQAVGNKPQRIGRVHVLPIDPGQFSQTASKMLEAQPTIQTSFNTRLQPHDHLVFRSLIDATGRPASWAWQAFQQRPRNRPALVSVFPLGGLITARPGVLFRCCGNSPRQVEDSCPRFCLGTKKAEKSKAFSIFRLNFMLKNLRDWRNMLKNA